MPGNGYVDGMASPWYVDAGDGRADVGAVMAEQATQLAGSCTFNPFTNPPTEKLSARSPNYLLSPIPACSSVPRVRRGSAGQCERREGDADVVAERVELLDMGAITRPIPPNHMSLRPPLVTTDDQIDKIVSFLREVLAQSSVRNGG